MYVVKVIAKVGVGSYVHSPVITGDGYHNFSDIFEAILVIVVMALASRPASDEYPFGRKNVESIFELAVGCLLGFMALNIITDSGIGLVRYVPILSTQSFAKDLLTNHESLLMGPEYFWFVVGTVGVSVLLSIVASYVQIRVGTSTGHASLVADGKETQSDGIIESVALVGILTEYAFNIVWIEYALGIVVGVLITRTAWEISSRGWRTLLQRSIGKEHEDAIRSCAEYMPGVVGIQELKTFKIGEMPICIMKIATRLSETANGDIKIALVAQIDEYMKSQGIVMWRPYIRFERPDPCRHRAAYAVAAHEGILAPNFRKASALRICDVEDDVVVRWKDIPVPADIDELVAVLKVRRVSSYAACAEGHEAVQAIGAAGISTKVPISFSLVSLGVA
jgi:cation diffusion facilitator family transporter